MILQTAHLATAFILFRLILLSLVVDGALAVVIVGLSYLRFLLQLPRDIRRLIVVAGTLYVAGALTMEPLAARFDDLHGFKNLTWDLMAGVEEVCEMARIMRYAALMAQTVGAYHFVLPRPIRYRSRRRKDRSAWTRCRQNHIPFDEDSKGKTSIDREAEN